MESNKGALDDFNRLCMWRHYGNPYQLKQSTIKTIRNALQTQAELVEVLKYAREVLLSDDIPWQPIAICRIDQAITKAEQGGI